MFRRPPIRCGSTQIWAASLAWFLAIGLFSKLQAEAPHGPVITTVRGVRSLTHAEAALTRPVHVRGQVTALSGWKDSFFVKDPTGGISVDRQDGGVTLTAGDLVEITGNSGPGLFAPVLISRSITRIGHKPLPPAPLRRFDELAGGQQDSQWVRIRGTVRSATITNSWGHQVLSLEVNSGGGSISVRISQF